MYHMMKTRPEIKEQAKARLAGYRGYCIGVSLLVAVISAVLASVTMGIGVLLLTPVILIATEGFFTAVYRGGRPTVSEWFNAMFENFLRKLGGYYWMELWIMLWSMLFAIPGMVKSIAYSMTPYILADCPNVSAKDALRLSMRMTDGYKMDIFVTGLSFIGWVILSAFTAGILMVLHVGPYMGITMGGVYEELKQHAIANGVIAAEEFEGAPVR